MKKQLSLLAVAVALVGIAPAFAETNWGARAGSSADLSSAPATRTRQSVNYNKYQTRSNTATYERQDGKNIYYTQPANRSAMYKQYASGSSSQSVRTSRSETVRTELKRKYYLAHPFYQPLQGKFGSITDISYADSRYDFKLNNMIITTPTDLFGGLEGTDNSWKSTMFSVKEDFSYGITDKIALVGMLRYEVNNHEIEWGVDNSKDKKDDNGLNLYGLGFQWRAIDSADWIGELSAYFEHQKDIANDFLVELKAGYKVSRTTIYGLARGWYVDIDKDAFGDGLEVNKPERAMILVYKTDDHAFFVEGGLGVFSVLDEDWTLNVEGIFGHYDWHNQFNIKGEIGWQPNDWFALGLYAKASLYDSMNDKNLNFHWYEPGVAAYTDSELDETYRNLYSEYLGKAGKAKIDNYQEWSIGLRAIFQF